MPTDISLACDAHLHVTPDASVAHYAQVQKALGIRRAVVVQTRPAGTDNSAVLEAIEHLGRDNTRGVAVIHPEVSDQELLRLHEGGVRGVRLSLHTNHQATVTFGMTEILAERIKPLGWHLQLHWTAEQIASYAPVLMRLKVPLVFDHMARLPVSGPADHPAFSTLRELLLRGRTWVKLSAPYLCSQSRDGQYDDVHSIVQALTELAPNRLLWGSDWPHVTEQRSKPDVNYLFDLLARWVPDPRVRQRLLIDNPAKLYGFDDSNSILVD
jgi:D-galactarolactone isomerase